jgi:hypothetical protein
METIKEKLFTGWHFMRWLRLVLGVVFMVQAIQMHDTVIGVIAGFFLVTAISNIGCCGAASCATPKRNEKENSTEEISYEEIK